MMRRLFAGLILGFSVYGAEPSKPPSDPRVLSVYPPVIQSGAAAQVTVRGTSLAGARALIFAREGFIARVLEVQNDPSSEGPPVDLVRIDLSAAVPEGTYPFRLVGAQGVSNELPIRVVTEEVIEESSLQAPVAHFPLVLSGKVAAKGEVDTVWIETGPGETLTFHCTPGTASFDPSLILAEPSGSWFDANRLNRIAFNDEPLHFPGLSNEARLVHRFDKGGRYAVQVGAFTGQGSADATYSLRITKGAGETPRLHPRETSVWEERRFTRNIPADWMKMLADRGGPRSEGAKLPAFHASADSSAEPPVMTAPGMIEGRIRTPAETHRIRLRLDKPQDLAIEIETPEGTMPRFNPVVRLMAPDGAEMVTNVYTKRNNNGLYMMKMIQAKATFTLRAAGDYLLEIRDITTDVSADDFAYRVLVRPQIPHVGKVEITEDRVNLEPGQAKALTVNLEREEGFADLVLVSAEGLPEGVTATAGMANPVEKPPLPNGGRLDRYVGKAQTATLMLSAADDARPADAPATIRVYVRTVADGKQSPPILVKEIPVMVIARRPT